MSDIMKQTEMVQHVSRNGSKNMLCHFFIEQTLHRCRLREFVQNVTMDREMHG